MHHALIALRAHRDLAKFELEDRLLRSIVAQRMTEPSSIARIVVDLATEHQIDEATDRGGETPSPIDALVWVSAEDVSDLDPRSLTTPLDEVAASLTGWMIQSTEIRDLGRDWVGTATPGVKIVFLLTRAASAGEESFSAWLQDCAETCASRMSSGGLSYHRVTAPLLPSPAVDGVFAFWFPTAARLEEAESFGVFDPVRTGDFVDRGAVEQLLTVEHRFFPNPNLWTLDLGDTTAQR